MLRSISRHPPEQPVFSVITVNLNSGLKLEASCLSAATQRSKYEHLIIDGLSADGSRELAGRIAASDPRVRLFSERDRGIYDAMNKGIRLARGRYVFFLGAGDLLFPGVLAEMERYLPKHERAFLYGDAMYLGKRYDGPFDWRKLYHANICHQAIFYGRELFSMFGGFDLRYKLLADWAMNFRCFGDDRVLKQYVSMPVATFEEGGLSSKGDPEFERDKARLFLQCFGWQRFLQLKSVNISDRIRRKADQWLTRFGHTCKV